MPLSGFMLVALAAGLYVAWNIGANDVANSMATSVASKAITLRQAVVLAVVLTLIGAVFVGTNVTNTVHKGIVDPMIFEGNPEIFIIGMLSALIAAGVWLQAATFFGMPVSTTHSVIGAIVGFGIIGGGFFSIDWGTLGMVVLSWVVSPGVGGIIGFLTFTFIQRKIIFSHDPAGAAKAYAPFMIFCVLMLICLAMIYKGLKNLHLDLPLWKAGLISVAISIIAMLLAKILLKYLVQTEKSGEDKYESMERVFRHLQVVTAAYVAFAHGSNDVANAVGPMVAVYSVIKSGTISLTVEVPSWALVLGGVGIAVGLSTWGYKVMETLGKRITEMTPSRGFCAEFSAATTVLIASKMGLPISTTHTIVGSIIGVGLARGIVALNLNIISSIIKSWLLTVPLTAGLTMVIFSITRYLFFH